MICQRTRSRPVPKLIVRALSAGRTSGFVQAGSLRLPCALGRGGVRAMKREGDGATPRGCWTMREAFYHPLRARRPGIALPLRPLRPDDGWCDAISDRNYNRRISHPYPASAERLWREDDLYDVIVVIGYNERPRIKGRGSAIFLHAARPGYPPTEGCVALSRDHLRRALAFLRRGGVIRIQV